MSFSDYSLTTLLIFHKVVKLIKSYTVAKCAEIMVTTRKLHVIHIDSIKTLKLCFCCMVFVQAEHFSNKRISRTNSYCMLHISVVF